MCLEMVTKPSLGQAKAENRILISHMTAESHVPGPSSAFPDRLTGIWIGSRVIRTWIGTLTLSDGVTSDNVTGCTTMPVLYSLLV